MKVKDLHARQGDVELVAEVIDKSTPRDFDKNGNKGKVCNAKIKDDSGSITLTLWNEDVDKIDVGDKIKIIKGYVGEWQGELQLSAGKFGNIEIVEKGTGKRHELKTKEPEKKSEEVFKNFSEEDLKNNEEGVEDSEDIDDADDNVEEEDVF